MCTLVEVKRPAAASPSKPSPPAGELMVLYLCLSPAPSTRNSPFTIAKLLSTNTTSPLTIPPDAGHNKGQKARAELRILGISLALLGSIGYALYEIWYKRTIACLLDANLMKTMLGLVSLCLLWIPSPLLNWSGIECFEVVKDPVIAWMILGIIFMGVLFNAGFMILIGLWGPVLASVGSLCTLVLITIVDHTIIGAINSHESDRAVPPFSILSFIDCLSILNF
ncbi:hypothetical protein PtA15_12A237 [Puccinia triticina]|uniref:EamA domain-containing protein n=1 Tax=Puccinia triticina TaxID=208348 RepID=A0ABY7D063_9BASI|nr:uncharacterized protein PtA15_12A237 [Puccinia triticina]WAQ90249.1 hypothetical protein PtA15_12A237 [Puccinia triticina]